MDYSKAFDRINTNILMKKLQGFGIPNFLLHWILDFLFDRTQVVKVGTAMSDSLQIWGTIPQCELVGGWAPFPYLLWGVGVDLVAGAIDRGPREGHGAERPMEGCWDLWTHPTRYPENTFLLIHLSMTVGGGLY